LPRMIKLANFEFIFDPKLARGGVVDKLIKHNIGIFFLHAPPRMTLGDERGGQFTLTKKRDSTVAEYF